MEFDKKRGMYHRLPQKITHNTNIEKMQTTPHILLKRWLRWVKHALGMLVAADKMKKEPLLGDIKKSYQGFSAVEAWVTVFIFAGIVIVASVVVWSFGDDFPESKLLFLHAKHIGSLPAILFSNFFHKDLGHLSNNLILFAPLGFFVFKQEGVRGIWGVLIGMVSAGTSSWLFDGYGTVSIGFSGAVFACIGILLVCAIRKSLLQVVILCVLLYLFLEFPIFETIRPTAYAKENNISWLGHLGGLIGGMMAQIRSLEIALEMLHTKGKITDKEFITIAMRINNILSSDTKDEKEEEKQKQENIHSIQEPASDMPKD